MTEKFRVGEKGKIIAIHEIMDVPEIRAATQRKVFYFILFYFLMLRNRKLLSCSNLRSQCNMDYSQRHSHFVGLINN